MKSLLYLAFGVGTIPEQLRRELESERMTLSDEGLSVSVHYLKYKSPRLGANGRKSFAGYIALSQERLVAKGYWETTELPLSQLT